MLNRIRNSGKKLPLLTSIYRFLRERYGLYRLKLKTTEKIFTDIYTTHGFGEASSASGPGSDNIQTRIIVKELPLLFEKYDISTVLDIPCGDFHWMQNVDLSAIDYTGADIVLELIQNLNEAYRQNNIRFEHLNMIEDQLPPVDLLLCRDCFVHFSYADTNMALVNICNSGSTYLLSTTFTAREENMDILTGQWRVINLERPPFHFPAPLKLINEGCTEANGAFHDKSLGLWKIDDLRVLLKG